MNGSTRRRQRVDEVRRIFDENGFGNLELLEGWDGDDLDELSEMLSEEEFQILLDQFEDAEDRVR